jgi:hypothetical protein
MDDLDKRKNNFLVGRIRAGDDPSFAELARALRRYKDPLLDYVAGLLDGKTKRKRGPKKDRSTIRAGETYRLWLMVRRCQRAYERLCRRRRIKPSYAREVACERVAERTGIPKDTIDKRTRPNKVGPNIVYL